MTWTFWLYAVPFAVWAACGVIYGWRSRWRSSRVGRAMLTLYVSLAVTLGLAALLRVVDLPHVVVLASALAAMGAVTVAGCVQLAAILRAQSRDRRNTRTH